MLTLLTKNKSRYIAIGLICSKCFTVIDGQHPGEPRLCDNCQT